MLLGIGAGAALAYAGNAMSAMPGHDHSKHSSRLPDLLDALNNCLDKGQRCISHCLVSFIKGDLELAKCAAKVHEMQAICDAFSYLVASNSGYIKSYANICERVCRDCEKECLKHKQHIECKACAAVVDQIKLRLSQVKNILMQGNYKSKIPVFAITSLAVGNNPGIVSARFS